MSVLVTVAPVAGSVVVTEVDTAAPVGAVVLVAVGGGAVVVVVVLVAGGCAKAAPPIRAVAATAVNRIAVFLA
ncbi:MAG: hypothetical protein ACXWKO_16855 [Phenylobacterium sp.]